MITISLYDLAREFGTNDILFFRPTAKSMYLKEISRFEGPKPGTMINCSFKKIQACDVSFADEFIINLQKYIRAYENVVLRLSDCKDEVIENIEATIKARNSKEKKEDKINVLYYDNTRYSFIDKIENSIQETFDLLQDKGEITARDVADTFNLEINSASNRLKSLYNANKVFRKPDKNDTGMQHIYYLHE